MDEMPQGRTIWRHYRGAFYFVLGEVRLEATNERAVRYRALTDDGIEWVRSLKDWHALVDGQPRFGEVPYVF